MQRVLALLAFSMALVAAQPFQPGQNLVPLGERISSFLLLVLSSPMFVSMFCVYVTVR